MPKASIIMPSLNVRPYIEQCMESVLGQTLQDIEVICVDADSTDGTHEILERYAAQDSRVRLLRDTRHSTGFAKNLGIEEARGEYIGIVEPDDYIELGMYERLYSAAIADQAEIVKCDYSVYITLGNKHFFVPKKLAFNPDDYNVLMNPQENMKPFGWEMYTWAGIYRTDFLREKKIRHHETKGAAYQDIGFWFQCYAESKRVKLIPGNGYLYCQDNPEASVKDSKRLIKGLDELEWVKSLYENNKDKWNVLKPAWGLSIIRFVLMASYNLSGDDLRKLLSCAHVMLRDVGIDEKNIKELFRPGEYAKYEMLAYSSDSFERAIQEKKQKMKFGQQSLEDLLKNNSDLVIVSAGSHGANLQALLKRKYKREISAFADNDKNKQGTILNGVSIMPLESVVHSQVDSLFLIANQAHGEILRKQLSDLGVERDRMRIIPVDMLADAYL